MGPGCLIVGDMGTNKQDKLMGTDDARPEHIFGETDHDSLDGGAGDDELTAVANTETGAGPDTLVGGAGDDTLTGSDNADVLMGGDGHDSITAGGGNDRIVGGAGDNIMTGADGGDIFVFSPADGDAGDVIVDLATDATDKIDLGAFGLSARELEALKGNITTRGNDVRIDLTDFGGGTILLQGDVTLQHLGDADNDGTIEASEMLSIWTDDNGDTTDDPTDGNGMVDAGEGGFFIV